MDGFVALLLDWSGRLRRSDHVGGREDCAEGSRRRGVERSLVQILVEVANIQLSVLTN